MNQNAKLLNQLLTGRFSNSTQNACTVKQKIQFFSTWKVKSDLNTHISSTFLCFLFSNCTQWKILIEREYGAMTESGLIRSEKIRDCHITSSGQFIIPFAPFQMANFTSDAKKKKTMIKMTIGKHQLCCADHCEPVITLPVNIKGNARSCKLNAMVLKKKHVYTCWH